MTLTRQVPGPNELIGWQVDPALTRQVATDLQRHECIFAERDNTSSSADERGGAVRFVLEGAQMLVAQHANPHFT